MQLAPLPRRSGQTDWQWILGVGMLVSFAAVFVALWSMQPQIRLAGSDPLAVEEAGTVVEPGAPYMAFGAIILGILLTFATVPLFLSSLTRESAMLIGFCAVVVACGMALGGYLSPVSAKAFSKLLEEGGRFTSNDYIVYGVFFYLSTLLLSVAAGVLMSLTNGD